MDQLVRATYLEMTKESEATPLSVEPRLDVREATVPCPEINHFFYRTIGGDWGWYERVDWTRDRWHAHVNRRDLTTWVATCEGCPAGYIEFIHHPAHPARHTLRRPDPPIPRPTQSESA